MALTPQGRSFIDRAEVLLKNAARIEASDTSVPETTKLRLGCFTDLAPFLLAPALQHLRATFADINLTYVAESFEGLLNGLMEGQIDIAITYDLTMTLGSLVQNCSTAAEGPDAPGSPTGDNHRSHSCLRWKATR